MNRLEVEQEPAITQPPIGASGVIVEVMQPGFVIEKDPMPAKTFITPVSLIETDTAVIGEDRDAVETLIADKKFIGLADDSTESAPVAKASPEIAEKKSLGKNILSAVRRSKLGRAAAVTGIAATAFFSPLFTETAKAEPEAAASDNVPAHTGGTIFPNQLGPALGPAIEVSNGIHYLPSASLSETPSPDIKLLMQDCTDEALVRPKVVHPFVMRNAGNYPIGHIHGQNIGGTLGFNEVKQACTDANLTRVSFGQVQMLEAGHWKPISIYGALGRIDNTAGNGRLTLAPRFSLHSYALNEFVPGKGFHKVRVVERTRLMSGEAEGRNSRQTVAEEYDVFPAKVKGNRRTAAKSEQLAEKLAATLSAT